ncbi:MAG TPA: alpha-E domain-containing protein [Polyangiales bacterium]|nr:alpha-E domain-containing protein [Polyangiales bacterium]
MMLSRVADSMFWMSRYIERAENIARFLDVNAFLHVDLGDTIQEQWNPLVAVTGDEATFKERYGQATRESVLRFLTFDEEYPNSIVSCLASARENARIIREYISTAMWAQINKFYLMVKDAPRDMTAERTSQFCEEVRLGAQLFVGVTDGTFSHGEGWHFARMGRLLERADKTSRILDVRYFLLLPQVSDVGTPLDIVQWSALLRCASALNMYRAQHGRISPSRIAEFLLLDADFPRAVRHCCDVADRSLRFITGTPPGTFRNNAEKRLGRLRAELDYTAIDDVFNEGFHEFIDRLQLRLNEVGDAIHSNLLEPQKMLQTQGQSQTQASWHRKPAEQPE